MLESKSPANQLIVKLIESFVQLHLGLINLDGGDDARAAEGA